MAQSAPLRHLITFDRALYVVPGTNPFPVSVLIQPAPPSGVFSFGVAMRFNSTNAEVVGVSSVSVVPTLSHDGPVALSPVIAVGEGVAAAKGTAEFQGNQGATSTNALLLTFLVRPRSSAPFDLALEPYNTLGPTEQLFVDGAGTVLDPQLEFGTARVIRENNLAVDALGTLLLNRQTGFFEQVVRVSNGSAFAVPGVRLLVTSRPNGWQVWNAQGETNGSPFIAYPSRLDSGQSVDLRVEFRIPGRIPTGQPTYLAEPMTPEPDHPVGYSGLFSIEPRTRLTDGSFLLEFSTFSNRSYLVQYSPSLTNWRSVYPAITGNGSRVQWIDYGPPRTDSPPGPGTNRFYRVLLLEPTTSGTNSLKAIP